MKNLPEGVEGLKMLFDRLAKEMDTVARAMLLAQQRDAEALEPQGEEPTIAFKHRFLHGGDAYTFVAFRADNHYWFTTDRQGSRYTWKQLREKFPAVAAGDFWVVTEWTHRKDIV